jgi:glycosyltransferase involved in cell wall biosynthesis
MKVCGMHTLNKIKIARIASVSYFMATQLKDQIVYLNELGMKVVVISGDGPELARFEFSRSLQHENIEISRTISPLKDLIALTKLFGIFRRHRFSVIHSTTPKAGLLSAVAGFFAGVPVRLHTFTGQPWVHRKGLVRKTARWCDKIIALLNTKCYADSRSQMEFLIEEGIAARDKIDVIGAGSLAGVDLNRFNPTLWNREDKALLRAGLGIDPDSKVMIFIGRITKDKGIAELIEAFSSLIRANFNIDLLLLGPMDQDCGGKESISLDPLSNSRRIHYVGYDNHP